MNHTYCENGYCEVIEKDHASNNRVSLQDKLLFVGVTALLFAITGVVIFYGAAQGVYVDLTSLS